VIAGIIGEALSKGLGTGGKSPTVSQVFKYKYMFYISMHAFGLIIALQTIFILFIVIT